MVAWKLQFLISVHFHFWNGVLYEEKHFQKVKFVISWKKGTPLVKSSALDFRTIIADHGDIYDKKPFSTKLWLSYHFIYVFKYPKTHLLCPNWMDLKNLFFRSPLEKHLILKDIFGNNSKTINFSKKVVDDIFVQLEIPHLLVYHWALWDN